MTTARSRSYVGLALHTPASLYVTLDLILSKTERQRKFKIVKSHILWPSSCLISLPALWLVKSIGITLRCSMTSLCCSSRIWWPIVVAWSICGRCCRGREEGSLGAGLVTSLVHFALDFGLANGVIQLHDHVVVEVVLVRRLTLLRDSRTDNVALDPLSPILTSVAWSHSWRRNVRTEPSLISCKFNSGRPFASIFGYFWAAFPLALSSNGWTHF